MTGLLLVTYILRSNVGIIRLLLFYTNKAIFVYFHANEDMYECVVCYDITIGHSYYVCDVKLLNSHAWS